MTPECTLEGDVADCWNARAPGRIRSLSNVAPPNVDADIMEPATLVLPAIGGLAVATHQRKEDDRPFTVLIDNTRRNACETRHAV